ncbi:MAG: hypothetical protein ACI4KG_06160 [Oscillospiraceae bacterium]
MDIFKQYDIFKEKCIEFPKKFEGKYFASNKLICHPTAENELISVCSDEEAHTNAICICRMGDMLLMSDDGEQWSAFNLAEARKNAEQNSYIYLTDLLAESAFMAEEWMIDGKHDTVIVNEEYMREKGMKYAPVTPLTNKVLHFKKYSNSFLWKPSVPGEIVCVDKAYIDSRFDEYFKTLSENLPDLSESETINFKLFDNEITIDVNTTRARTIEMFFAKINELVKVFAKNDEIFAICDYSFAEVDFILEFAAAALRNNGIDLSKSEFATKYYSPVLNGADAADKLALLGNKCGIDDIDCIKLAFIDAVVNEYKDEINYSAEDTSFYTNTLRRLELGNYSDEEEQYLISELLSHKPGDYRVFYYANKKYPNEAENIAAIASFWEIAPQSEDEMENTILSAYILDENFDEQGRFCAGYEESVILKEQLEKVIEKYGISSRECIDELEQHIEAIDKERRTFNGTLFATPEEKKLAVKNEVYIQELCTDLSALNESELNALNEHIENTTLDVNTKSKYQLKVKLALNNVHTSMLEQRCLKLPLMTIDEIAGLREKIAADDYPEAVVKPFEAKIKDAYSAAQTAEIEKMLEGSESLSDEKLDGISEKLSSGRYDFTISDYYKQKIEEIKENNIRTKLHALVDGFESFSKEKLSGLIEKLSGEEFPKRLTYSLVRKITDTLNNYELNEAARAFDGVDFADKEQLEKMKKIISDKLFADEILAPYIVKVEQREKELLNEELSEMCRDIDTMSQEELDKLKDDISSSDKEFDEQLVSKYLDKIAQRVCELKNSELAELCKYIFSMEQEELDELKEKLSDEKYDKEFTAVYYRKIAEREQELVVLELDKLCENIDSSDIPELEELKAKIIDDDKYADICDRYISDINDRIDAIKISEYKKLIASVAEMNSEEVEEFRKTAEDKRIEIGEELYEQSIAVADERDDAIENEEIEQLCEGIEEYDFEKAESVKSQLSDKGYAAEKIAPYIARIEDRIIELHTAELESYISGYETMSKEQLVKAQINIQQYDNGCPEELKEKYSKIAEAAIADIADREARELCGDIKSLSAKKSADLIRKLNTMTLDENAKNKYIDVLDAHIASIKENESKEYIKYLTDKMSEFGINAVHLCVPGMSNLFHAKYDTVCATYVSAGRYELPILVHEGNAGDSFTMTTEYLYTFNRGVVNRIKIDDIASFQAKKTLMTSVLTAVERNGNSTELPNALNKNVIENVAKVLTALVSFVHDQRSAEHMKELLENAVQEKAMQAAAVAAAVESAPVSDNNVHEAAEEDVKVKFCDQCGAKILSANAKFCAECGNKLM